MTVNYARIALASLGATVAYFVLGFIMFAALPAMKSEFMKYPDCGAEKQKTAACSLRIRTPKQGATGRGAQKSGAQ